MSNAKTFIDQIKSGDVTDAIKTIKESLGLKLNEGITTSKLEVLSTYGFSEKFEKEEDKEEKSKDDDGKDKEDDSDEGKKDKEEDKSEEEGK